MGVFQLKNYKGAVLDVFSGFLVSSLDVQNFGNLERLVPFWLN